MVLFKSNFRFLPSFFLFSILLNIKIGYGTKIKFLPNFFIFSLVFFLFFIFYIALAICVNVICDYLYHHIVNTIKCL